MNTRDKILETALSLFSQKGYEAVSVEEIASVVGIKAPSLYKHFSSKKDIFNAILEKMKTNYEEHAKTMHLHEIQTIQDASVLSTLTVNQFIDISLSLFTFFLHDSYTYRFRKMLTIGQFHNYELSEIYSKEYHDDPLTLQTELFQRLCDSHFFKSDKDPKILALEFYSPIYMLICLCDRQPDREKEAQNMLKKHIIQFHEAYHEE